MLGDREADGIRGCYRERMSAAAAASGVPRRSPVLAFKTIPDGSPPDVTA